MDDCPKCKEYREVIRRQGQFIQDLKRAIRDFNNGSKSVWIGREF